MTSLVLFALFVGRQSHALSTLPWPRSSPSTISRPHSSNSNIDVFRRGESNRNAPARKLPVLGHVGHSHGHHEHGHDHSHESSTGLTWGTALRAFVVAAAAYAMPMHPALVGLTSPEGVGTGIEKATQLKRSVAVALGLFLVAVEASKGMISETRIRLAMLYKTVVAHQASARTAGLSQGRRPAPTSQAAAEALEKEEKQRSQTVANTRAANRVTFVGAAVNVLLAGFKLVVGAVTGSAAMVADAGHSLSDLISDVVTLVALRVSRLPPDADHPWGHGRFEALGALAIAVLLGWTALGFGTHAYHALSQEVVNLLTPTAAAAAAGAAGAAAGTAATAVSAAGAGADGAFSFGAALGSVVHGMVDHSHAHVVVGGGGGHLRGTALGGFAALAAALVSIFSKEALFRVTKRVGERLNSQVLIANAWHHRSDAMSSVVALVGIGGACLGFPLLDPLAGLGVAGMVAITGVHVGVDALRQLTDTVDERAVGKAKTLALEVEGVLGVDDNTVRARRMGSDTLVDLMVQVSPHLPSSGANQVAELVRFRIREAMPEVTEVLVHVAPTTQKPNPMLAYAVRGADAIEADVRKTLRLSPGLMQLPPPSSSSPPPPSTKTGVAVAAAAASTATSPPAHSSPPPPSPSPPPQSSPVPPLQIRTVHRVTVHYLDLTPCVEVLLDVTAPPSSGDGSHRSAKPTLEDLRELGGRAKAAVEEGVADVASAEVHLRLVDSSTNPVSSHSPSPLLTAATTSTMNPPKKELV